MTGRKRVAVVGGGIAGLSAAWALAADCDVVLLERERELGAHATGRSAATLSETSGPRTVCALARASRAFLESPPDGFADHPLLTPRGLLWIGRDGDAPALDEIAAVAASGVAPTARRVDPGTAQSLVGVLRPTAVAAGGVWEPDAVTIDVAALVASFARGAQRRGAVIRAGCDVRAIARRDGGWRVEIDPGDGRSEVLDVDAVVNAAGAWGDVVAERAGVAPLGLQPLRRTACVVAAATDTSWPLVMDVAGRFYFEPESGGLLLSPADEHPSEPVDARPEEDDVAWALEMLHAATTLESRHVRRAWAGLRTFTADRVPAVGPDPDTPNFWWLVGQGGAGIKSAPAAAAAIAAIVTDAPWPAPLAALGVGPRDLSPARLRP